MSDPTRTSRPQEPARPPVQRDALRRYQRYGPIQPMDSDRGFLARLLHRLF